MTPKLPAKKCNCKKSRCLKLYCDCFAAGDYCKDCSCSVSGCRCRAPSRACLTRPPALDQSCLNTELNAAGVNATRESIKARNPNAFDQKIQALEAEGGIPLQHAKGCHCKKSHCLKKYCECFQLNVKCGTECKCEGCKNQPGRPGQPEGAAAAAMAAVPRSALGPITPVAESLALSRSRRHGAARDPQQQQAQQEQLPSGRLGRPLEVKADPGHRLPGPFEEDEEEDLGHEGPSSRPLGIDSDGEDPAGPLSGGRVGQLRRQGGSLSSAMALLQSPIFHGLLGGGPSNPGTPLDVRALFAPTSQAPSPLKPIAPGKSLLGPGREPSLLGGVGGGSCGAEGASGLTSPLLVTNPVAALTHSPLLVNQHGTRGAGSGPPALPL